MSETQEKTKNCTACKIRDEKILDLQRQVITLETSKDQPTQMSCKECAVKDKQLFLLEQNRVKIQSEVEHKDRLISTLCSDLQSKEAMMKTYNKLVRTNSILDKQIIG
jgi:tRNA U55 pseudouridine synthase TruB